MKKYTKQDILDKAAEEGVQFIRLQFTDIFGTFKNVAITTKKLEKALDNKCMFDGSSIEGYVRMEESDMYLYPDLNTFEIVPWKAEKGKTARMICDVYRPHGVPFEGDSRYVLKKVLRKAAAMGYSFNVGPECEFFLFHTDEQGRPTTETSERAGYFDVAPLDSGENARRDIVLNLEEMGFDIEASHHEVAPGQHEIDFKYDNALKTADHVMTLKLVVKSIAREHGLYASFMPKPLTDVDGSGMHINMSLNKDGENIFADPSSKDGLSDTCRYFVAGLIKHARAMSVFTNPLINSYKRLVPGFEAPVHVSWSAVNRCPMIRIPAARGKGTRIEFRSPDSAANPYLVMAVCLAAGLDGISNKLEAPDPVSFSFNEMTEEEIEEAGFVSLPRDLKEACDALEEDEYIKGVLGEHILKKYLEAKKKEWSDYQRQVTEWELNKYLYTI